MEGLVSDGDVRHTSMVLGNNGQELIGVGSGGGNSKKNDNRGEADLINFNRAEEFETDGISGKDSHLCNNDNGRYFDGWKGGKRIGDSQGPGDGPGPGKPKPPQSNPGYVFHIMRRMDPLTTPLPDDLLGLKAGIDWHPKQFKLINLEASTGLVMSGRDGFGTTYSAGASSFFGHAEWEGRLYEDKFTSAADAKFGVPAPDNDKWSLSIGALTAYGTRGAIGLFFTGAAELARAFFQSAYNEATDHSQIETEHQDYFNHH